MVGWSISEAFIEQYEPLVLVMIDKIEKGLEDNLVEFNLSGTSLNPHVLGLLLERLGYEQGDRCENGWQFDFWIPYMKDGCKELEVRGTGMTFTLWLAESGSNGGGG